MNEYVYSARHNAFFPVDMIDKYKSEGWDLSDAKEVNQNIISEFMAEPPQGKIRIAGDFFRHHAGLINFLCFMIIVHF